MTLEELKIAYEDLGKKIAEFEEQETSDVTEVIRCKDCKHYEYGVCTNFRGPCGCVQPDDFCSYGEKSNVQNTHVSNSDINPDYVNLHDKFIGRKRG